MLNISYVKVTKTEEPDDPEIPDIEEPDTTDVTKTLTEEELSSIQETLTTENTPDGSVVNISITDSSTVEKLATFTELSNTSYVAVDFSLLKDSIEVQPDASVSITISVPESIKNAESIEVYRLEGETLIPLGETTIVDGKITFTTDHFSTFIFKRIYSNNQLLQGENIQLEHKMMIQKKTDSSTVWYTEKTGDTENSDEFFDSYYGE